MQTKTFLEEFENHLDSILQIVRAKNKDYSGEKDPFKNFRLVEEIGLCTVEQGILTRMLDKISRIVNLVDKDPEVVDESIQDTLKDLAAYSIILLVYLREKGTGLRQAVNTPSSGQKM